MRSLALLPLLSLASLIMGASIPLQPVSIDSGARLSWQTAPGNTYQVQWAPDILGPWTDLGDSLAGDGEVASTYFPETSPASHYRLMETVPETAPVGLLPVNGGFETGNESAFDQWDTGASQPPIRSAADARSGSFSMHSLLVNAGANPSEGLLWQHVDPEDGSLTGAVSFDFSFWAKQISSGPSYVQQYKVEWLNSSGREIGGTGLVNFSGEVDTWTQVTVAGLLAPLETVKARISFRFVTGAVADDHGEVFIDDVALDSGEGGGPGTPEQINYLPLTGESVTRITWGTLPGVPYQPVTSTELTNWDDFGPELIGDGSTMEILVPRDGDAQFFSIEFPGFPGPPETGNVIPLFSSNTELEPETTIETSAALITRVGDRARDRHAREGDFKAYDHYLPWYWQERTLGLEIIDRVAKGGTDITFNYTTQAPLGDAEFRTFFRGITTEAEYYHNQIANPVVANQYSATVTQNFAENRPLAIGDRIEIEVSQFLEAPAIGRSNYYGTAILYVVGDGIVPWQGVGSKLDSFPLPQSAWLGGTTTLPYQYSNEPEHRFKQTAGNISPDNIQSFMLGRRLHHTDFGDGSHSEPDNPSFDTQTGKLGPHFIARSCVECHTNNGRALPPAIGAPMLQTVMKVGTDANGTPHPALGSVLQPQSVGGPTEAGVTVSSYTTINGQYGDGSSYSLRRPNYTFTGVTPDYFSARLAPPLVGMGLLEAVDEATIAALADPDDQNGDGISGRLREVIDPETGDIRLGRFTAKGAQARLSHQIAAALNTDMGVTTPVFPIPDGETTGETPELNADELDKMTRYVALLGVGARRDLGNTQAIAGEALFTSAKCAQCHIPQLDTGPYHPMAELRNQTIHPYTDLLLHDLGSGLADNMGESGISGSEWRTPPLWGIGLTSGVSGGEAYLHDGRARTLEEAILWHGGEAEDSKEAFRTMTAADRAALIAFLKSL